MLTKPIVLIKTAELIKNNQAIWNKIKNKWKSVKLELWETCQAKLI